MTILPFPERPSEPDGTAMYCISCHTERKAPSTAGDPGPCKCGGTMFVSAPLLGSTSGGGTA